MAGHMLERLGSLRLVERLEHAGLDLALQEGAGGHHHVIAGAAGQQLRLQHLVAVEHVVDDLDAGLGGELLEDRLVDIVRPVVDVDDLLRASRRGEGELTAAFLSGFGRIYGSRALIFF
jgi:hypothetical protein